MILKAWQVRESFSDLKNQIKDFKNQEFFRFKKPCIKQIIKQPNNLTRIKQWLDQALEDDSSAAKRNEKHDTAESNILILSIITAVIHSILTRQIKSHIDWHLHFAGFV